MEIFELRYFLGVAQHENIHRASEKLHVSPASLSKAIARLEGELETKLFHREGRGIRLSAQGMLLRKKASEIVHLEQSARVEVAGHRGELHVVIAGPEILLSKMGLALARTLRKKYPDSRFEFHATDDEKALERVARGDAHLAIVTADVGARDGLAAKTIEEAKFQTYVGEGHPLFAMAKARRTVPIEEILKHPFVSPDNPLLGKVGSKQSLDGWRDDQFPRRVQYLTSSLKLLEEAVVSGTALAYLPSYLCESLNVESLKISGCPYSCVQKIKLVARSPKDVGWLNRIF